MYVKPDCLPLYIKIKKSKSLQTAAHNNDADQKNEDIILTITIKSSKSESKIRAYMSDKVSLQNLYDIILNA